MSTEPTTEAGRQLLDELTDPNGDPLVIAGYARSRIKAIERAAAAAAVERLDAAEAVAEQLAEALHSIACATYQECGHLECRDAYAALARHKALADPEAQTGE